MDCFLQIQALKKEVETSRTEHDDLKKQTERHLEEQLMESQTKYDELDKKSKHLRVTLMTRFSEAQHKHDDEKENLMVWLGITLVVICTLFILFLNGIMRHRFVTIGGHHNSKVLKFRIHQSPWRCSGMWHVVMRNTV